MSATQPTISPPLWIETSMTLKTGLHVMIPPFAHDQTIVRERTGPLNLQDQQHCLKLLLETLKIEQLPKSYGKASQAKYHIFW
jgi:hypothetical protein